LLGPGDTISIPVRVFRGFENVGDDIGFLFAVLGGDDPGHVTWAPYVFDSAKEYGLILLEDGSLVDTSRGERIPDDKRPMTPTTNEDVARLRRLRAGEMGDCVVKRAELQSAPGSALRELREYPIIGAASDGEGLAAGKINWLHGFHVRHLSIDPGVDTKQHLRHEEEVILMQSGKLVVSLPDGDIVLWPGDVITVPIEMPRRFANRDSDVAEAYVVRGGDHPRPPTIVS
jgi:mannose-6-phosphate isomerase-like protein (cupin superfamily)